jgi:hypothetical protein
MPADAKTRVAPPRRDRPARGSSSRIIGGWRAMSGEQRLAVTAAIALLVTMFLPWYSLESRTRNGIATHSISAFGDVSFVEAAVFLVAVGVIFMLFARAEHRAFHLPGGDGTIVMIAGAWATFLIFYRVFDRPDGAGYPVGIEWGFFLAFIAAGGLTYSGLRIRVAHQPEPPLPGEPPEPPISASRMARLDEPATVAARTSRPRASGTDADEPIEGQLRFEDPQ